MKKILNLLVVVIIIMTTMSSCYGLHDFGYAYDMREQALQSLGVYQVANNETAVAVSHNRLRTNKGRDIRVPSFEEVWFYRPSSVRGYIRKAICPIDPYTYGWFIEGSDGQNYCTRGTSWSKTDLEYGFWK